MGGGEEAVRGLRGFPVLQGLLSRYKPILIAEVTEAQGGKGIAKSIYQGKDQAASTGVVPLASPAPAHSGSCLLAHTMAMPTV